MSLSDQLKSLTHHAYLLIGSSQLKSEVIESLSKNQKIRAQGNPDFFDRSYQTFTIDDARELKALHETRPVIEGGKKIFILTMNGITVEAQNALLKLLEEPAEYAHFFLIIPSGHLILPTVKSRMHVIDVRREDRAEGTEADASKSDAEKFLGMSAPGRLEFIKGLMAEVDKEKKTKQDAIAFLNSLEEVVYEKFGAKKGMQRLEAIDGAKKYIHDRAPSVKMLLEYVALNI